MLLMGGNLLNSDPEKGIKILTELSLNNAYPALLRALALQYTADAYMQGGRNREWRTLFDGKIFSKEPYKSLLAQYTLIHYRMHMGIRYIYERAVELYPLPAAEYRIAIQYARPPLAAENDPGKIQLGSKGAEFYIAEAKKYLEKGDEAMLNFTNTTDPILGEIAVAYAYWLKGSALGYLGVLEKKSEYHVQAEKAFKDALAILDKKDDTFSASHSLWARFYYASFLESVYGESRKNDIVQLLAFIQNPEIKNNTGFEIDKFGFSRYLTILGSEFGWGYDKAKVLALAKLDQNFADFLKGLGWKL